MSLSQQKNKDYKRALSQDKVPGTYFYANCAGGDVGGLQAELERLASLAGANPDNKVQAGNKIDKTNYRNYNIDPSSKYVMMKSH